MNPMDILLIAVGLFAIVGAALDWNWFMESRKARLFVMIFTRNGARVFYILLGTALITVSALLMLGVIERN